MKKSKLRDSSLKIKKHPATQPRLSGRARLKSQRKRVEATLRDSEERYHNLFNSIDEGFCIIEMIFDEDERPVDYRFLEVNPAFEKQSGLQGATGKRIRELIPETEAYWFEIFGKVALTGQPVRLVEKVKSLNSWFDVYAFRPAGLEDSRKVAILFSNITERKRAEQRLAAFASLGRRLNAATEVSTACRLIVQVADELFGWDACVIVLYDEKTHRCRSVFNMDVVNGQRREVPAAYEDREPSPRLRRVMEVGAELILREEPLLGSGDLVPFGQCNRPSASLMFVPVRDGQKIIGILSIQSYRIHAYTQTDLDTLQALADHCGGALARIQSRESQRASEAKYRTLIERMGEGLIQVDEDDIIRFVNPQICRMLGYTETELLGQHAATLLNREEDRALMAERNRQRTRGVSEVYEILLRKKSGEFLLARSAATPVITADGQPSGSMAIITDVTERKQAEDALRESQEVISQHAAKLEKAVSERTAKLTELIGELEAFSYSIAHDMRAPLRAMQNFSSILLADHSGSLDAEAVSYLEKIKSAAERQDKLIQDALIYSRVLRADMPLEPIDLQKLVNEIIETYPHIHPPRAKISIEGKLPSVLGNTAGLTQCISNLLGNAVKFVAPGVQPQLTLRAEEINSDALIWVEDNGVGIEANDRERIFKMFERTFFAKSYDGTGIGLAIVRKAVERMHGKVGVESEPGKGSRFWIQLKKA